MNEMKRRNCRIWFQVAGGNLSEVGGHGNKMYFATSKFIMGGFCAIVDVKKLFRSIFFGDEKGFYVGISMFVCRLDVRARHKIDDHAASDDEASR